MRQLAIYIFGIFFITSCRPVDDKTSIVNQQDSLLTKLNIDTSLITIIPFDTSDNNNKQFVLSSQDLTEIERLLTASIDEYNLRQTERFNEVNKHQENKVDKNEYIIDLKNYKRQYILKINSQGEKEVWIKGACDGDFGLVMDGGKCYFDLEINLTKKTYSNFGINSEA
jgi:hypothetical protein